MKRTPQSRWSPAVIAAKFEQARINKIARSARKAARKASKGVGGRPPAAARDPRGSISVSADCYAKIERIANERGESIARFVEDRITQYLNRKGWN